MAAQEDASRSIVPSCPSLGWTSGVHKLTAIPNGNNLTTPKGGFLLETCVHCHSARIIQHASFSTSSYRLPAADVRSLSFSTHHSARTAALVATGFLLFIAIQHAQRHQ